MKIAIANIKGGVGKTTSSINLAACLAPNISTLLVDLDPQGACALSLGIDSDDLDSTIYEVLIGHCSPHEAILPTPFGFDLLPSNIDLSKAEIALVNMVKREYVIERALTPLFDQYEVILLDTPPQLGLLTVNAFALVDAVIVPVSTQLLSLRGLQTLLETIEKLKRFGVNESLQVAGVLPTKYDARTLHSREVLSYLESFTSARGIRLFEPIKHTVRFDEAPNEQAPFVTLYPEHEATRAYRHLAEEVALAAQEPGRNTVSTQIRDRG